MFESTQRALWQPEIKETDTLHPPLREWSLAAYYHFTIDGAVRRNLPLSIRVPRARGIIV